MSLPRTLPNKPATQRKVGHIDRPLRPLKKMRFISKSNKGSAKACAAISTDGHQVPGPRRPLIMLAQNPTLLLRHHHGNSERQLLQAEQLRSDNEMLDSREERFGRLRGEIPYDLA